MQEKSSFVAAAGAVLFLIVDGEALLHKTIEHFLRLCDRVRHELGCAIEFACHHCTRRFNEKIDKCLDVVVRTHCRAITQL